MVFVDVFVYIICCFSVLSVACTNFIYFFIFYLSFIFAVVSFMLVYYTCTVIIMYMYIHVDVYVIN